MQQYHFSIGKGFSRLEDRKLEGGESWIDGSVVTRFGIVLAYSQGDKKSFHHTSLEFAYKGFVQVRSFDKRYTKRGIARLAKQFAEDVFLRAGRLKK